eukprot:jgi/Mesvir1/12411/Mv00579-RA.1
MNPLFDKPQAWGMGSRDGVYLASQQNLFPPAPNGNNEGGSRIVALLKKVYKPVLFAKLAIVLVAFSILFILKPKSYRFLDVFHTLIYGRPNSVTKPGSDEVLVQREATKAMRIIAASTMLIVAIIG